MNKRKLTWIDVVLVLVTLSLAIAGILLNQWIPLEISVASGIGYIAFRWIALWRTRNNIPEQSPDNYLVKSPEAEPTPRRVHRATADDPNSMIEEMLDIGRHALLLRPQIVENLSQSQFSRATEALNDTMSLVPEGNVTLQVGNREPSYRDDGRTSDIVIGVEAYYLDRYPVTNTQFQEFVEAGGYEQISLWDPEMLPAVLDFVDRTGLSSPRFWENGTFPSRLGDHPVVGICWYEAAAYACWAGKRLATDAQWIKAGSWPVATTVDKPTQRKYPWGDEMDRNSANLWGSGPGKTVSVDQYEPGASVGGIYQLIGNVWEWTRNEFLALEHGAVELDFNEPMKSLRGGAFDTYFDNQANCQFQSGDISMVRKHNIGFRCALAVSELDPVVIYGDRSEPADQAEPLIASESSVAEIAE